MNLPGPGPRSAQLGPQSAPPSLCRHALPCSPAGDHAPQGCKWGFPCSIGTTSLSFLLPVSWKGISALCPWKPVSSYPCTSCTYPPCIPQTLLAPDLFMGTLDVP